MATQASDWKTLLIGLDCVPPDLLFDRFRDDLPVISALVDRGLSAPLTSTIPPITVPAWMCMMTGKDPGTLGIYGLRNRRNPDYDPMAIATSRDVRERKVWDFVGESGGRVILVGVPQTYPPAPVNGVLVSSFLAPGTESTFTHPPDLKTEIQRIAPGYMLDVPNFRSEDRRRILEDIHRMTAKRFRLFRHFLSTRDWQFAMMVEMGTDRIHHAFWRYLDETHRDYQPNSPYTDAIVDYYRAIDREIGLTLESVDAKTTVALVSDHGAKRIDGGFCVNEWLIERGDLVLKKTPAGVSDLDLRTVDWSQTRAWGEGGYYARIFLNVQAREPSGIVGKNDYERTRDEIADAIESVPGPDGRQLKTVAHRPDRIYRNLLGHPPDLIVHLDDLYLRSIGSVGHERLFIEGNDAGPDDANHAQEGIFVLAGPGIEPAHHDGINILDVAPTLLHRMGLESPGDLQGTDILAGASGAGDSTLTKPAVENAEVYSDEEQKAVEDRLRSLGYL